jgi:hypothetical protein
VALSVSLAACFLAVDSFGMAPALLQLAGAVPFLRVFAMDFFVNTISFWMSWLSHFWDFSLFQYVWYIFFFVFIWSFVARLVHL